MIAELAHLGLVDDDAIELDRAALEIAALDHPGADLNLYLDRLGEFSEEVLLRAASAGSNVERARVLSGVLFGRYNFDGDRETYDDPANADLISVIDRRRGLPVSLAILYVAIARRIEWPAHALNTPGHVLTAIGGETAVLTDPFNAGAFVDEAQLSSLLSAALGRDAGELPQIEPMSNRHVLVRLMMNQATRAERVGDIARTRAIFHRITTVAPDNAHGWWERARVEALAGDTHAARASLGAMLETTRDPATRTHINAALDALGAGA